MKPFTYKSVHYLAGVDLMWRCIGQFSPWWLWWSNQDKDRHGAILQVIAQALSEGYAVILHRTTTGYTLEVKVVKQEVH